MGKTVKKINGLVFRKARRKNGIYFGVAAVFLFSLLSYSFFFSSPPVDAATNINDASNFGALPDNGRRVVRTSSGTLYAFLKSGTTCQIWNSSDGAAWSQQNSAASPTCETAAGMAIDSAGVLHLLFKNSIDLKYTTFSSSTNLFSGTIDTICSCFVDKTYSIDIAVDSNDKPHIIYGWAEFFGLSYTIQIDYKNKVSGSWSTVIWIAQENNSSAADEYTGASLVINEDNIPEISYIYTVTPEIVAKVGDANNPTSFTGHTINSSANGKTSIGVDSSGNTWITYNRSTDNNIMLVKHNDLDGWTTWQTPLSSSVVGTAPSLAINGTDIYLFYENSLDDIAYNKYSGSWLGSTTLQTGTFQEANAKGSYYFNNQGGTHIDYLYSDGTDVYWDKHTLTANTSPSGPTLIEPANSSTGIRGYPIFKLRTSDADNDYLRYKFDICSDSTCTSILRTIDQTASQTGWYGQDASVGTAYVGNSSLSGSTIAVYKLPDNPLTANTQYWWRAYSIDTAGSNIWSSVSSIQSFTIGPVVNIEIKGGAEIRGGGVVQ